jgi:hypothetical protein
LESVFYLFAYLRKKQNGVIVLDPTYPEIDGVDWKNIYSDHAGDVLIRQSRTGFIISLNNAPADWYSKRQGTVETSVFGAEFVAMKVGFDACCGLRNKLRMMGVPIDEPFYCYRDNMSVIQNTHNPESTLKKKSNLICYHYIRECVAMGEAMTVHIRS